MTENIPLTYSANWLASEASCQSPDGPDSPGAKLLLSVQDEVNAIEWTTLLGDTEDEQAAGEIAWQIADNAPDVYTYPMWQQFVDLCAFQEDPSELGGVEGEDMNTLAGRCLFLIAHRLAVRLIEIRKEELGVGTADD